MDVQQIDEGLWRWTTRYGEWGDDVGAVYYEAPDAIVLIDPLIPEDEPEAARFLCALDRDVERANLPVHVLITVFWHVRSTEALLDRYGASLHAPRRARAPIERRAHGVAELFGPGAVLPGGVVALPTGRSTEVMFWLPRQNALVTGDVLLGDDDGGGVRFCPASWLPASVQHGDLQAAMQPLLDLPVERVLVSHGKPVLENGHAALTRLLRFGSASRL